MLWSHANTRIMDMHGRIGGFGSGLFASLLVYFVFLVAPMTPAGAISVTLLKQLFIWNWNDAAVKPTTFAPATVTK